MLSAIDTNDPILGAKVGPDAKEGADAIEGMLTVNLVPAYVGFTPRDRVKMQALQHWRYCSRDQIRALLQELGLETEPGFLSLAEYTVRTPVRLTKKFLCDYGLLGAHEAD